jgi:16S rRNA (cytidine1402-2'-O)-methyltransferase
MSTDPQPGTLYLVGTPLGNLEDMTFRAIRVLKGVDLIAAEDTRHTGKLLQYFQIQTPQTSYHEHNRSEKTLALVAQLQQGKAIALVSDAGMPGICDPGYDLVAACGSAGVPVVPIPGPTAAIAALTASGLPTAQFVFEGFLPAKRSQRQQRLAQLCQESRTLILYEAPHRLRQMLPDLAVLGGDRPIVLARELTKLHEEFWRGTIAEAVAHYANHEPKGEFTLVIAGAPAALVELTDQALLQELQHMIAQGMSRSMASKQLAQQTGVSKRRLYQLALECADCDFIESVDDP